MQSLTYLSKIRWGPRASRMRLGSIKINVVPTTW